MVEKLNSLTSLKSLISISGQKLLLPLYHTVSNTHLPHISNLYPIRNVALFTQDLEFFCKHYTPISLYELQQYNLHNNRFSKPVFHLTFDDGLSELYHIVAPILLAKGIPATFFINSGFIDNQDLFYRYKVSLIIEKVKHVAIDFALINKKIDVSITSSPMLIQQLKAYNYNHIAQIDAIGAILEIDFDSYLTNVKPYLTSTEIQQLLVRGFTIGAHSVSHPHYKDISIDARKQQTTECINILNEKFSVKSNSFAFPFSDEDVPKSFFQWLYHTQHCATSFGISGLKHDVFINHLHRIPMEKSLHSAEKIIKNEYWYYLAKFFLLKNNIRRND